MVKFILMICILFMSSSCIMMSDEYYRTKQIMWQAKMETSKAWAVQSKQPLATFTTKTGETFIVNNPNQLKPMVIQDEPSAMVQGLNTVLNSSVAKIVGGGWAAGYMLGKVQGNEYNTGADGEINVTQDSGNSTTLADGSISNDNSVIDQTSTPTVVTAPDPVIVTQPAYNDPIIIQAAQ